jgi:hypothetical protein
MAVLNQIDLLQSAEQRSQADHGLVEGAKLPATIQAALDYNQDLLKADTVPISLAPDSNPFNLGAVELLIEQNLERALLVQLNRRRIESVTAANLVQQLKRTGALTRSLFNRIRQ